MTGYFVTGLIFRCHGPAVCAAFVSMVGMSLLLFAGPYRSPARTGQGEGAGGDLVASGEAVGDQHAPQVPPSRRFIGANPTLASAGPCDESARPRQDGVVDGAGWEF